MLFNSGCRQNYRAVNYIYVFIYMNVSKLLKFEKLYFKEVIYKLDFFSEFVDYLYIIY